MVWSYLPPVHKSRLLVGMLCAPSVSPRSTTAPGWLLLTYFSMTLGSGCCPALLRNVS